MPTKQNDDSKCEQSHEKNQVQNNKQNQNVKCELNTEQPKGCSVEPAECSNNNSDALCVDYEKSRKKATNTIDITIGILSAVVGLFYGIAKVFNYQIPYNCICWVVVSVVVVGVVVGGAVAVILLSKSSNDFAKLLGEEKFSSDIWLFISSLVVYFIMFVVAFVFFNIFKNSVYVFSSYAALISIIAILCTAKMCKKIAEDQYNQLKIELDYMPDENRYIPNTDSQNDSKKEREEREGFAKKKSLLKYHASMKSSYECIMILYIVLGMYMGFGKLW
ncbi:hypothetical protein ACMZ7O_04640 [Gardnerella greenwoodii]|uniref:hypothetical protein n=1 Tax=Gardnerella greenwoodii TaxID=2914925 RepID=UPI0039EE96C1